MTNQKFKQHLAETLRLLRDGKLMDAKQEFRTIKLVAEDMPEMPSDPDGYWETVQEGMDHFVAWIDLQQRTGEEVEWTKEVDKQFQEDVYRVFDGKEPKHFQMSDRELSNISSTGMDSELGKATEAVKQDQIDFLEEEIRKSEEHLMELKQKLNELDSDDE